ncbi:MAG: CcoQ/FixQ family Cbb3-type cytochrome c oxidase assembly chaperone [Owenweeksia sp.]|nr:CcoQ/FixQ family Cbb3-type cytochrome c oxidase assembly chaperone [Owenweeksia sp.]MBF99748.1 CcoQ/FixQ family Cbb3-type cytochrome c oxidase assembly chaperone [Owenweeksia sp.]|tara:strand:+ start:1114 stop:1308 length:195 start_codon:yes stop_codon:yes gene_type:complete
MLKFIKHHMETISGIEIYPMISFLIFFSIFMVALIYVLRADKQRMHKLGALPLDAEPAKNQDHE